MFDFMDCVLHSNADTRGAALTGGGVRDSPGMRGVKENAACEAYVVHVANFPEVLWGGVCFLVYKLLSRSGLAHLWGVKKMSLIGGVSKTTFLF